MYHRNYTTYLQKELDFLKLLVSRFHEQEKVNGLEMNIALLKTQEIYEQLLQIKLGTEDQIRPTPVNFVDTPVVTEKKVIEPPQHPQQPDLPQKKQQSISHPVSEKTIPNQEEVKIYVPEKKQDVVEEIKVIEKPIIVRDPIEKKTEPITVNEPVEKKVEPVKAGILAEKIKPNNFQPINETLAQKTSDLSSKLQTAPLSSIVAGIGLNDKFLYIRELFKNDNALYSNTIRHIDTADSLGDAMDFINHHFDWDKNSETTQKFIHLVHRRHGNQ